MVKLRVAISEQRDASYDIVIGRGLLADLPAFVKAACPAGRYVVITDSHVAKLYGKQVMARFHDAKLQVESLEFPAGERNKTRETWALLSDRMLAAQIGRDSAVIALGRGGEARRDRRSTVLRRPRAGARGGDDTGRGSARARGAAFRRDQGGGRGCG